MRWFSMLRVRLASYRIRLLVKLFGPGALYRGSKNYEKILRFASANSFATSYELPRKGQRHGVFLLRKDHSKLESLTVVLTDEGERIVVFAYFYRKQPVEQKAEIWYSNTNSADVKRGDLVQVVASVEREVMERSGSQDADELAECRHESEVFIRTVNVSGKKTEF